MISRNIRVYLKNIGRNKLSFFINFFGLSLALSAAFLIYVYISYETSYDRQLGPEVYRISIHKQEQGRVTYQSAKSYPGLAYLLKDIPAVKTSTRILYEQCLFRLGDKKLANQQVFWADSSFVDVLGLRMLKGPRGHLLGAPHEAIISRTTATKLFGPHWQNREDLFKSTLLLNEGLPFKIVGVFEDYPVNSHLVFDYVLSFTTLTKVLGKGFGEVMPPGPNFIYTYVKLNPNSNSALAESQLNALLKQRVGQKDQIVHSLDFQPAGAIHLDSHLADELNPNASRQLLDVLRIVAGLIILIALINYINLSVSMATRRIPEIGMRKVLGATRKQLAFQFGTDSVLSFLIVFAISFLLVIIFTDLSYRYLQIQIPDSYYYSGELWGKVVLFTTLITLAPAVYLGLMMAKVKPLSAGVSQLPVFGQVGYLRKGLVVLQFVASIFLISSTMLISRQVKLMQHFQLGYDKQNVVVVKSPRTMIGNPERENLLEVFKARLQSLPGVEQVSSGSVIPGEEFLIRSGSVRRTGGAPLEGQNFSVGFTDGDYFKTLAIRVVAGKTFDGQKRSKDAIVNRRALKTLGFSSPEEALGQEIQVLFDGDKSTIVGVIEDYHHLSVHTMPSETIFLHGPDYEFGYYPVRLQAGNWQGTLGAITQAWQELYPNDPFDYFFLDSFFQKQYQSELRFERTFFAFSLLAILISCLGLFGLSAFTASQRTREMGIRKVYGASVPQLVTLLSRDFLRLVLLANLLALPLAWWAGKQWLENYAFRAGISWQVFILAALGSVGIALLTISFQSFRAALANPVESLRSK